MAETDRRRDVRLLRQPAQVLALPAGWRAGLARGAPDWRSVLGRCLAHEAAQRRLFPWIAVCLGLGIVLFFQADGEPAPWVPLGGLAIFSVAAVRLRRN